MECRRPQARMSDPVQLFQQRHQSRRRLAAVVPCSVRDAAGLIVAEHAYALAVLGAVTARKALDAGQGKHQLAELTRGDDVSHNDTYADADAAGCICLTRTQRPPRGHDRARGPAPPKGGEERSE